MEPVNTDQTVVEITEVDELRDTSNQWDAELDLFAIGEDGFSEAYLRFILATVRRKLSVYAFEPSHADLEDIQQDAIVLLLIFFRNKGRSFDDIRSKSAYLVSVTYKFVGLAVIHYFRSRGFRKQRSRRKHTIPKLYSYPPEAFSYIGGNDPMAERNVEREWQGFVSACREKLPPRRADVAIALASAGSVHIAAAKAGVTLSGLRAQRLRLRETLGPYVEGPPSEALAKVTPKTCGYCGRRIDDKVSIAKFCSPRCKDRNRSMTRVAETS